jgi:pimeloyl-ACP methyl ester carboxylesterase
MANWVLDAVYGLGGYQAARPDRVPWHVQNGYDPNDFEAVFRMSRTVEAFSKSYAEVASQIAGEAATAARAGHQATATRLYLRSALLSGRGQYHLFADSELKSTLYQRSRACYDEVLAASAGQISRLRVPFDDGAIFAIVHRPAGEPLGTVIVIPGMDAFKEERHVTASMVCDRGFTAVVMDGPGQGESLVSGLKVTVDNYERAVAALIDALAGQGHGDGPVGIFGTSMGSYWASRATAYEKRITACAVAMGCYGPTQHMFTAARPAFRDNYKYMTGISDDDGFDEFVAAMSISGIAKDIAAPYLMVHGEYDELNPLEDAMSWFDLVPEPKEAWIFEDEIHPMGRRAGDFLPATLDWVCDHLSGRQESTVGDRRTYFRARDRGGAPVVFSDLTDLVRTEPSAKIA